MDRLFAWIFNRIEIKPFTFDVGGSAGWKWYGGFGLVHPDNMRWAREYRDAE